jgi:hypothetical protein
LLALSWKPLLARRDQLSARYARKNAVEGGTQWYAMSSKMTYRFLGNSGLLVSKLPLGSWMDFSDKYTADAWYAMMKLAFEHGVNSFDDAEAYGRQGYRRGHVEP